MLEKLRLVQNPELSLPGNVCKLCNNSFKMDFIYSYVYPIIEIKGLLNLQVLKFDPSILDFYGKSSAYS